MTIETTVSAGVGALSFVGAAAIQQTTGSPTAGIVVPLLSALVGGAISYGVLRGTVQALSKDHDQMRTELHSIRETVQITAQQVARIEGTMERRGAPREN